MSPPRPILKRSESHPSAQAQAQSPKYPRQSLLHGTPPNAYGVHFPPSPTLTRTFSAYSSASYDRSPIVVTPNSCALPERGCPGRTYTLDDAAASSPPSSSSNWRSGAHNGRHLHPRAVAYRDLSHDEDDDHLDEQEESQRTPTRNFPILPPLIPDLSSESEESDGFTSPPPEPASFPTPTAYYPPPHSHPISAPSHPPIPHSQRHTSLYSNESYFDGSPTALSFLPHAASPGDENQKARRRKQRDQSKEKPRRAADGSYKSLSVCKALANCSLDESGDGCLGGF